MFTSLNLEFFNSENLKNKNVFTLERTAQATLVVTKRTQKYKK